MMVRRKNLSSFMLDGNLFAMAASVSRVKLSQFAFLRLLKVFLGVGFLDSSTVGREMRICRWSEPSDIFVDHVANGSKEFLARVTSGEFGRPDDGSLAAVSSFRTCNEKAPIYTSRVTPLSSPGRENHMPSWAFRSPIMVQSPSSCRCDAMDGQKLGEQVLLGGMYKFTSLREELANCTLIDCASRLPPAISGSAVNCMS